MDATTFIAAWKKSATAQDVGRAFGHNGAWASRVAYRLRKAGYEVSCKIARRPIDRSKFIDAWRAEGATAQRVGEAFGRTGRWASRHASRLRKAGQELNYMPCARKAQRLSSTARAFVSLCEFSNMLKTARDVDKERAVAVARLIVEIVRTSRVIALSKR